MRVKLTLSYVKTAVYEHLPYNRQDKVVWPVDIRWDSELPGFGMRVYPPQNGTCRRTWWVRYRTLRGRQRSFSNGNATQIPLREAREQARALLAKVQLGEDPYKERREQRKRQRVLDCGEHVVVNVTGAASQVAAPNLPGYDMAVGPKMAQLYDRYMREHAERHKKPTSIAEDRRAISKYLSVWELPEHMPAHAGKKLADVPVLDVTRDMMKALHDSISEKYRIRADSVLDLLSTMFNLAEGFEPRWRLPGTNPAGRKQVMRNGRRKVGRQMTAAESRKFAQAMHELAEEGQDRYALAAIWVLFYTPARHREVLHRRWDELDVESRVFRFENRKTDRPGQERSLHIIPLSQQAMKVITALDRQPGNPHIFCGAKPGRPLVSLQGMWNRVRDLAKLGKLRIHDLKHTGVTAGKDIGIHADDMGAASGTNPDTIRDTYTHLAYSHHVRTADSLGDHLDRQLYGEGGVGEEIH